MARDKTELVPTRMSRDSLELASDSKTLARRIPEGHEGGLAWYSPPTRSPDKQAPSDIANFGRKQVPMSHVSLHRLSHFYVLSNRYMDTSHILLALFRNLRRCHFSYCILEVAFCEGVQRRLRFCPIPSVVPTWRHQASRAGGGESHAVFGPIAVAKRLVRDGALS
jgi:hypothetical protein